MHFNYTLFFSFICVYILLLVISNNGYCITIAVYFLFSFCLYYLAFCDNNNICEVKSCEAAL